MGYPQRTAEEAVQIKCCNFITKWLQTAPPAHTMVKDDGVILPYCTGGVCMSVCFTVWLRRGSWCCLPWAVPRTLRWRSPGAAQPIDDVFGGRGLPLRTGCPRPPATAHPLLAGIGAVGVSVLELGTGLACRRLLHVEVWDYSQEWGNLAGLVCPKYTALWFLLCLWVLGMMRFARFCRLCGPHKGLKYTLSPCFFVCEDWKSGLSPWMSAIIKP